MDEMEGVICRTIKTRNIKRIVVNMPWKEKRDFLREWPDMYSGYCTTQRKENRRGNLRQSGIGEKIRFE